MLLLAKAPPPPLPLTQVGAWRGAFASSFNTSAALWETNTSAYETWLTNYRSSPIKTTSCLGFSDTGNYGFAGFARDTLLARWLTRLPTRPNLVFWLSVPTVAFHADWDFLIAGTAPPGGGGNDYSFWHGVINTAIVNNETTSPGSAALVRIRLGWESNGDWYAWGHRPVANGFTGSTYTPAKQRAGWRQAASYYAGARALGTKLVWNPSLPLKNIDWTQHWPGYDDDGTTILPAGEALVDIVAGDSYDQFIGGPGVPPATRWNNMYSGTNGISPLISFAAAHGNKPVAFPEWGVDLGLGTASAGDDFTFIQNMRDTMQSLLNSGKFAGHNYWESNSAIISKLATESGGQVNTKCAALFKQLWGYP